MNLPLGVSMFLNFPLLRGSWSPIFLRRYGLTGERVLFYLRSSPSRVGSLFLPGFLVAPPLGLTSQGLGHLTPPLPLALPSPFSLASQGEYSVDAAPSGQMLQTLIWCHNCLKRIHTCRKPIDCGVHEVVVHELEDLVLDCELSWHRISAGVNNYTFYRVLGSNSLLLSVGKEPTLTKTMVRLEDAGTYRCELANMKTSRAGVTHFHVRVLPQRAGGAVWSSPTTTTTATTEYEFSTDWDLSLLFPTALANPSECPKSEDILRGRLIGLLLWGLLVLLIAFVTAILCFRPGKVINYIKAWRTNQKEAAQQAQTAMEPQAALESQGGREPQGAQKPQSARKPQAAPKPSVSKGKLSASKLQ
ncbi:izumo sperm-egg fusion protein 1 isoform X4 [Vulpes lagopus]|uniref:izumo sperm-egg fusion protein 1 isoform X4 n=1 Tax=Vulpes lagopus TaxID=494514 RepID=UPI001BC919D6|nr:izumo sperm-egg fusion protein 1 isoform X4 [Vulpes lagopus]